MPGLGLTANAFDTTSVTSTRPTIAVVTLSDENHLTVSHRLIRSRARRASDSPDRERTLAPTTTISRFEGDDLITPHLVDTWSDGVLDELVANLVCSRSQDLYRAVGVANGPVPSFVVPSTSQGGVRSGSAGLAPVPAGPLSQPQRPKKPADGPEARLADLLMVGGFCGFVRQFSGRAEFCAGITSSRKAAFTVKKWRLP